MTAAETAPCVVTRSFVTAGRAIFTVALEAEFARKNALPAHYTYRVAKVENEGRDTVYFVGFLTGTDNENDYSYVGMLNPNTGDVRLTRASKLTAESMPYRILCRVLANVYGGTTDRLVAAGWGLNHEGRCCRCGRTLTTPESCRIGIGPECKKFVF